MRANNARYGSLSSSAMASSKNPTNTMPNGNNNFAAIVGQTQANSCQKQQMQMQQFNQQQQALAGSLGDQNFNYTNNNVNGTSNAQQAMQMMRLRSYSVSSNGSDGLAHNSPRSSAQNSPLEPSLYNAMSITNNGNTHHNLVSTYFSQQQQFSPMSQNCNDLASLKILNNHHQQHQSQQLQLQNLQWQNQQQQQNQQLSRTYSTSYSLNPATNLNYANAAITAAGNIANFPVGVSANGSLNFSINERNEMHQQQQQHRHVQRVSLGSIFSRRTDYTPFNALPRHKINSYHIKMEDDGSHGNDEVRWFILSNLSANKMSKACCIFCQKSLTIYDRYPLLEGTFFLSPVQHHKQVACVRTESLASPGGSFSNKCGGGKRSDSVSNNSSTENSVQRSSSIALGSSIPCASNSSPTGNNVTGNGRRMGGPASALVAAEAAKQQQQQDLDGNSDAQYINCVCMGCLEGWNGEIKCKFCNSQWIGSHLILGSMYSFDIFAAQPCCRARLQCNNCTQLVKMTSTVSASPSMNQDAMTTTSSTSSRSNSTGNNDGQQKEGAATTTRTRGNTHVGVITATETVSKINAKVQSNQQNRTKSSSDNDNGKTTETLDYFSHYSQKFRCKNCNSFDYHFVKPVALIYNFSTNQIVNKSDTSKSFNENDDANISISGDVV